MISATVFNNLIQSGLMQIALVRMQEKPIAIICFVSDGRIAWIPWCGALPEFYHLSPNHLSHWAAINLAINIGCEIFDFGRSPYLGSTYEFKRKWGAKPIAIFEYKNGDIRKANVNYAIFNAFSFLWKAIPNVIKGKIEKLVFKKVMF